MKNIIKITAGAFIALVAAIPFECLAPTIVTVTVGVASSSPYVPSVTSNPQDLMTISIDNAYGTQLSLSFESNAGSAPPVGNPTPTTISPASATQYTFPKGWAGRIVVGPNTNENASKIEGSYTDGPPDIDISYVDGFSVPITCSSEGVVVTGCNIDLFEHQSCETLVPGPVCLNPARFHDNGPPTSFFAVCAGAAYTFPKDDLANKASLRSKLITCCIGTSCKAPDRQSSLQILPSSSPGASTVLIKTVTITKSYESAPSPPYPTQPLRSQSAWSLKYATIPGSHSILPPYPTLFKSSESLVSRSPSAGSSRLQYGSLPVLSRQIVTTIVTTVTGT